MAYTLAIGDLLKIRVICFQGTQSAVNVRHYVVSNVAGASVTDVDTAARFDVLLSTTYKLLMSTTATYRGIGVQKILPLPVTVEATNNTGAGPGTAIGEPLPPQVAGLLKFTSALAGRRGRGFLYTPFPSEADNTGNGITSAAYQTVLTTLGNTLIQNVTVGTLPNTATLKPVIVNRTLSQETDITGFTPRPYWSQQKRRSYLRRGDVPAF